MLRRCAPLLFSFSLPLILGLISEVHARQSAPAAITVCSFITADQVNVRVAPTATAAVVTRLNRGDGVQARQRQGSWVEIVQRTHGFAPDETFTPLQGWVSNQYINGCSEDQFDRWRN